MSSSNNISQAALADLRALTAEHVNRFATEGRAPVKGAGRRNVQLEKVKDSFQRPSPGLIKRLAAEARNDSKRRVFQDDEAGPSDQQRREILLAKAKKYEAMRRGDFSGMTEKELQEAVLNFDANHEDYSDSSSDVDESAALARSPSPGDEDDLEKVEYTDEMGRTRYGTRKEKREAERAKREAQQHEDEGGEQGGNSAYAEVLQSNVIHGDQNFFPVYEPDPDAIKAKYLAAEEEARAHHYDSTKEVRAKGAGQYQFSLDEEERAKQMASLKAQRQETEQVRKSTAGRSELSAAQALKKRKMDERKALIEAKRSKLLGGAKEVERLKSEKKAAEADSFLAELETEMHQ